MSSEEKPLENTILMGEKIDLKLKADSIVKVIDYLRQIPLDSKMDIILELKELEMIHRQNEKDIEKVKNTNITQTAEQRIEEEKKKTEQKLQDITNGKRLPHWILNTGKITSDKLGEIPTYEFIHEEIAIHKNFMVIVSKNFDYVWLKFDYNEDANNSIRGKRTRKGLEGGIPNARWVNMWRIPFQHIDMLIEKGIELGGFFSHYNEIVDYMLKLEAEIKQIVTKI